MKHLKDASEELTKKLISALDHAVQLKKDGIDPMIPFAFVYSNDNGTLKSFLGNSPEYADKMFERTLIEEKPDFVIYGYDGYLTVEGSKYDAILLKAFDRGDNTIYLVGQRFQPKTDKEECIIIGNPTFIGSEYNDLIKPMINQEVIEKDKMLKKKNWWQFW